MSHSLVTSEINLLPGEHLRDEEIAALKGEFTWAVIVPPGLYVPVITVSSGLKEYNFWSTMLNQNLVEPLEKKLRGKPLHPQIRYSFDKDLKLVGLEPLASTKLTKGKFLHAMETFGGDHLIEVDTYEELCWRGLNFILQSRGKTWERRRVGVYKDGEAKMGHISSSHLARFVLELLPEWSINQLRVGGKDHLKPIFYLAILMRFPGTALEIKDLIDYSFEKKVEDYVN